MIQKGKYFKRLHTWFDIVFLVVNVITIVDVFDSMHAKGDEKYIEIDDFESVTKRMRTIELIGIAIIFFKSA